MSIVANAFITEYNMIIETLYIMSMEALKKLFT